MAISHTVKAVGEQCAGNPQALSDEGVPGNSRTLLYLTGKRMPIGHIDEGTFDTQPDVSQEVYRNFPNPVSGPNRA
jgi:hypothetical protein